MLTNKKGIGFDDITEILVTIFFILLIVFLFMNYQISKENTKFYGINIIKRNIEAHELLMNYLQRNTTFDINNDGAKEKITMTDLIIFSFLQDEKDTYNYLEEETKKILIELKRSDRSGWNMRIYLRWYQKLDYREKVKIDTYTLKGDISPLSEASVILPLGIDNKYIMVSLQEEGEV